MIMSIIKVYKKIYLKKFPAKTPQNFHKLSHSDYAAVKKNAPYSPNPFFLDS